MKLKKSGIRDLLSCYGASLRCLMAYYANIMTALVKLATESFHSQDAKKGGMKNGKPSLLPQRFRSHELIDYLSTDEREYLVEYHLLARRYHKAYWG